MSARRTPPAPSAPGCLVLVTRPQPDAAATLAALAGLGFSGIAAPLQRMVRLPAKSLPPAAAILLTSRNTVRAIARARGITRLPAYCVSDSTAALARASGFAHVQSADGDARALARLVKAVCDPQTGPLLLPAAVGAGLELAGALRRAGFRVQRRTVYRMQPSRILPSPVQAALDNGQIGWALFHAAGAAQLFAAAIARAGLADSVRGVAAVTISAAAAKPLGTLPWQKTSWPARPTEAAMLALLPRRQMDPPPARPARHCQPAHPSR